MAIHIQLTEEAEAKLRKDAMRNKLSSLLACILLLGGGGLIMALTLIYIAAEPEAEFLAYTPPSNDLPPTNNPTTQQLSSKASSPSTAVSPSVIVSTSAAPVAMAQVDVPMDDSMDVGVSVDLGMGLDMGLGEGLGEDGAGMGSSQAGGSTLVGTFYDFKLTKSGAPSKVAPGGKPNKNMVHKILHDFLRTWSPGTFASYYQSKTKLYSPNFMLPSCKAEYAPIAYQCKDKCKPSAWAAVYRGKVRAPKSGKFRFVGTGDDFLAVRFAGKTVLEAGWAIVSKYDETKPGECGTMGATAQPHGQAYHKAIKEGKDRDHKDYEFITVPGLEKWNKELGGLTAGTPFTVKEGNVYPIEIIVSEIPGGAFGFALLIQDEEQMKNKTFDLFRTNFSAPNAQEIEALIKKENCQMGEIQMPPYNEESGVWVSVP